MTRSTVEEYWSTLPDRVLSMQRVFNEIRSHQIERYQATLKVPRFRANARGWVEFAPDTTPTGRWHPTGSRRTKALKREMRRLARYLGARLAGRETLLCEVAPGTFVFDAQLGVRPE